MLLEFSEAQKHALLAQFAHSEYIWHVGLQHSEMPKNQKFVVVVFSFLLIHFGFTIVYVTPEGYFPHKLKQAARWYMAPAFDQAWDLFAPNPPVKEKTLLYRYSSQGEWSAWINPGAELLQKHDAFRFSNASILYRMNQNAGFHLWQAHFNTSSRQQLGKPNFKPDAFTRNSFGFKVAGHYCLQHALNHAPKHIDSVELMLVIDAPPPPGTAQSWKSDTLFFPVYHVAATIQ
jgi:hypothetical protein